MPLKIVRNDITQMKTQAIVNPASRNVEVGDGCNRAVHNAAGFDKLLAYRRDHIGDAQDGEAFITPGFDLPAQYIIHTVSPLYIDGSFGEEEKLRNCYRNSLRIAAENHISSIAFPLLATGSFEYPQEEGMRIAIDEINAFLIHHDMLVYIVVFGTSATRLGERLFPDLEAFIDHNYVEAKRVEEYGDPYSCSVKPEDPRYAEHVRERDAMEKRLASKANRDITGLCFSRISPKPFYGAAAAKSAKPEPVFSDEKEDIACGDVNMCSEVSFDESHEKALDERLRHLEDTFQQYLMYLIKSKGYDNADVWKRALVDKKVFSKIKNNPDYHPKKITALCLCVGAQLNLDETRDLLARAGYALSPADITDVIFAYFIQNEIYDMIELDIQLEEHGIPCIIQ